MTRKNRITPAEIKPGPLPQKQASVRRLRYSEYLSLQQRLVQYFRQHPEERMLVWLPLWKGNSPQGTMKARTYLRTTYLTDPTKYLISQRGNYLYFTINPPDEEATEVQKQAYLDWVASAGRRGGRPQGSKNKEKRSAQDRGPHARTPGDEGHDEADQQAQDGADPGSRPHHQAGDDDDER